MDNADEWRRLRDLYSRMNEGELEVVASEAYDLTEIAKPLLRDEIARRGLKISLVTERGKKPIVIAPDETGSRHDLVLTTHTRAIEDARLLKEHFDAAGILTYWGLDHVESPEGLDFSNGVDVAVREEDYPSARELKRQLAERQPETQDIEEFELVCPKCQSAEIVFHEVDENNSRFRWSCDACGHEWFDDGVQQARPD